jgi:crescentin
MSLAMNTLSLLTAGLLGGKNRAGAPEEPELLQEPSVEAPVKDEGAMNAQFLSAVGRENEDIRRRHESIIRKASLLSSLEDDLSEIFGHTSQILDDLERTKSELAKREALIKFERESREAAQLRINELSETHEHTQSELDLLRPEMARLSSAVDEAESRILQLDAEGAQLRDQLADLSRDHAKQRELMRFAEQELEAARNELKKNDLLIAQRNTDVAESALRAELAEQAVASLKEALAESQSAQARAVTDLEDTRIGLDASGNRIANLESELHDFQQEHTRMRALWQREADQHRSDVAGLQAQLDQATGVGGVHERLLNEARAELQMKNDEIKRAERRAQEAELAVDHGEQKFRAAEAARDAALVEHATAKAQQKTMLRRVKPLIAALREKQIEARRLELRAQDMESRLEARASEIAALSLNSETRMRALIEELEAERSRRILAEGALSADRDTRTSGPDLHEGSGTTEEDSSVGSGEGELPPPQGPRLLLGRPRGSGEPVKLKRGRRPFEAA